MAHRLDAEGLKQHLLRVAAEEYEDSISYDKDSFSANLPPQPRNHFYGEGVSALEDLADGVVHAICLLQVLREHLLDVEMERAQVCSNANLVIVVVLL